MKKIFLAIAIAFGIFQMNAVDYNRQGLQFTQVQSKDLNTGYTWKDKQGEIYPIYITSTGRCYILKISKKTGKAYKSYLPKDVSRTIASELGIEYKEK